MTKNLSKTLTLALTLALTMSLSAGFGSTALAAETNYRLAWGPTAGSGAINPVSVVWNEAASELSVTYVNAGNYFIMNDIGALNELQRSTQFIEVSSSAMLGVSGVTSRVVSVGDARPANSANYGTAVLKR